MEPYVDAVVAVTVMRVLLFVLHACVMRECEIARLMQCWCVGWMRCGCREYMTCG